MTVEPVVALVSLAALHPAPWNPRTIRDERFKNLCDSIQADPAFIWRRPILAQLDGTIYAGNMRYRAAEHLGMAEVPAIVEDVPDTLAKERALRDNAQWGDWQDDELARLLGELQDAESNLDLLGIEEADLKKLLAGPNVERTDPDAVPPVPDEPTTKPGDLWLMGEHRLLCGDATNEADAERLCGAEDTSCMWTDPPYGVEYVGKTRDALIIQNDTAEGLAGLLAAAFANADKVLEPGAPFYIARPPGALSVTFGCAILGAGWQLHEELQWVKDSMVLGHSDYHVRHETVVYGWTPGPGRSGRGKHEGSRWYGDNSQTSVFEIPRPKASPDHPTGKPVELVERCLANSTQHGDGVYDPFLGSGTTLIACERLGRRCYAMEIEPRYVDVAVRRWQDFTGQKAVLDAAPN